MPLILVVEQEQRYVERIVEALSPQGWDVVGVTDRDTALQHRQDQSASLLIVNGEVPDAADLVAAFGRQGGGPGAVVLVPEDANDGVHRLPADEVLQKPFTDQEIRLVVRRCLVGLSNPATQQATTEPAAPTKSPEPQRLTSQDLFGDMVSELESAFKLGVGEAEEEEKAEAAEVAPPPETEIEAEGEVVEALEAAELEAEEMPAEPPETATEEAPVEEAPAEEVSVEEPAEEQLAEEEPAEKVAAPDLEGVEEDLRQAPPSPPEEPVEAAETVQSGEPETSDQVTEPSRPPRDPAAVLEERIRRAAEEGKRLASSTRRSKRSAEDLDRSTDSLLEKALSGIDEERPRRRRRPARATEEEVDHLVGSVVDERNEEEREETEEIEPEDEEPAGESESPALDLFERDDHEREEGEYQARLKLIWAAILVVAVVILALILLGRGGDEAGTAEPAALPPEQQEQPVTEPAGEAEDGGGEAAEEEVPDASEESSPSDPAALERELEAQRRQLQEEIARSRATEEDGP